MNVTFNYKEKKVLDLLSWMLGGILWLGLLGWLLFGTQTYGLSINLGIIIGIILLAYNFYSDSIELFKHGGRPYVEIAATTIIIWESRWFSWDLKPKQVSLNEVKSYRITYMPSHSPDVVLNLSNNSDIRIFSQRLSTDDFKILLGVINSKVPLVK